MYIYLIYKSLSYITAVTSPSTYFNILYSDCKHNFNIAYSVDNIRLRYFKTQ